MEESAESTQFDHKLRKKCGFWGCCAAFVRWAFILLFTVILLGGLYFKAPWKILVLDTVLLALLTVIPKKKRKHGWLTLAAMVLAATVWIFIPEKDSGDWRPYSLDEEIKAFNDKYAVSVDENAAGIYDQLSERIRQDCQVNVLDNKDDYMGYYKGVDEDKIKNWLKANQQEVFDAFTATSQSKTCFEEMGPDGSVFNYRNMDILKYAMRFINDQITLDIQEGDLEQAIDKITWGLNRAQHLKQQPSTMHYLCGTAIEAMFHRPLWKIITTTDLSENQLDTLSDLLRLNTHSWINFLERNAEFATIQDKARFASALYEIGPKGNIRFSGTIMGIGVSFLGQWLIWSDLEMPDTDYWQQREQRIGRFINGWFVPKDPDALIAMFDNYSYFYSLSDTSAHDQAILSAIRWKVVQLNCDYLVKLNILLSTGNKSRMQQINQRVYSEQAATHILLAMKQYHNQHSQWPKSLELLTAMKSGLQLTDPLNGDDYFYEVRKDDFVLYSKGLNNLNENGKRGKGADDILIWPQGEKERKQMLGIEEPDEVKEDMMPMMMGQ